MTFKIVDNHGRSRLAVDRAPAMLNSIPLDALRKYSAKGGIYILASPLTAGSNAWEDECVRICVARCSPMTATLKSLYGQKVCVASGEKKEGTVGPTLAQRQRVILIHTSYTSYQTVMLQALGDLYI